MKKTGILIGLIIIVISASAVYLLFNTKNETTLNSSEPVNKISDEGETKKPENDNLDTSVKEHKSSPAPEVNPNIPDLQDKPEPGRTLLDSRKDDTERNEAAKAALKRLEEKSK